MYRAAHLIIIYLLAFFLSVSVESSDVPVIGQAQPVEIISKQGNQADFGEGGTTSSTARVSSNQGLPNSIANAWTVKITDGTDNRIVIPAKEGQQYQTSDHGIPMYGVDPDTPRKYRPIRVDSEGDVYVHLVDANNNDLTTTTSGTKIALDTAVVKSVLPDGAATSSNQTNGQQKAQLVDSLNRNYQFTGTSATVALPTQITGGDGLYRATVDSLNRLSVNANIQFPEAVYFVDNLRNAGSKAMNVNGTLGAPINFTYTPSGQTFYVEELSFYIADNAAFASGGFGALGTLTNGILIEYQSKGVLYTYSTIMDNADLLNTLGSQTSFGALSTALLATDAYLSGGSRLQQRIALDPAFGDFIRARVRDNLTGLTNLNIRVKVWRVN